MPVSEVQIMTPRGKKLAGDWVVPVDSCDICVVLVHSFLGDRHSAGWFDFLSAAYRGAGYQTMAFDLSGCGQSDDDVLTSDNSAEDIQSVCSWLLDNGVKQVIVHAHGYGATASLRAAPLPAATMILTGPISGSTLMDWSAVFSSDQLDQLEIVGHTIIPGSEGERDHYLISKQTLADLTIVDTQKLATEVTCPVLLIHDGTDQDEGMVESTTQLAALLPDGSRLEVMREANFGAGPSAPESGAAALRAKCLDWLRLHAPAK